MAGQWLLMRKTGQWLLMSRHNGGWDVLLSMDAEKRSLTGGGFPGPSWYGCCSVVGSADGVGHSIQSEAAHYLLVPYMEFPLHCIYY